MNPGYFFTHSTFSFSLTCHRHGLRRELEPPVLDGLHPPGGDEGQGDVGPARVELEAADVAGERQGGGGDVGAVVEQQVVAGGGVDLRQGCFMLGFFWKP